MRLSQVAEDSPLYALLLGIDYVITALCVHVSGKLGSSVMPDEEKVAQETKLAGHESNNTWTAGPGKRERWREEGADWRWRDRRPPAGPIEGRAGQVVSDGKAEGQLTGNHAQSLHRHANCSPVDGRCSLGSVVVAKRDRIGTADGGRWG